MSDVPELTPEDVKEILRLVDESGLEELELVTPRFTVRFRRGADPAGQDPPPEAHQHAGSAAVAGQLVEVTAPMVGTAYRAVAPDEPPFVEVGSLVDEATTVCLIEVMKLMSSIAAGVRGTVVEVCFDNASPVQYGDLLFRVKPT